MPDMISKCLSFGRQDLLQTKLGLFQHRNTSFKDFAIASIKSDQLKSLEYLEAKLAPQTAEVIHEILLEEAEMRLSKDMYQHLDISQPTISPKTRLSNLSFSFPVFNENVEKKWCERWKPKHNVGGKMNPSSADKFMVISMTDDIRLNEFKPFCCLEEMTRNYDPNKKLKIELANVNIAPCIHVPDSKQ